VFDRVLVCSKFNSHYREASCEFVTRVGSDHNPMIVNIVDNRFRQQYNFRFELHWLDQQGFKEYVKSKWLERGGDNTRFLEKESKLQLVNFVEGGVQITKAN
jgi:hypothetical protein